VKGEREVIKEISVGKFIQLRHIKWKKINMKFSMLVVVSVLLLGLIMGCGGTTGPSEVSIGLDLKYDINSHELNLVSVEEPNKDYDMGSHNQYYSLNDNNVIKLRQGDTLTINLTSEVKGGFHIHGYNILNDVEIGKLVTFTFIADATGKYAMVFHRFMDEDHTDHADMEIALGSVEVFPN